MHMVGALLFKVPAGYHQNDVHLPHAYRKRCHWPEPELRGRVRETSESWN